MNAKKNLGNQVSFDQIYNDYITQIEKKTELHRKHIYAILAFASIIFLIGRLEIIVTYLITMYFPAKWSYESYKKEDEDFYKMWGTYWSIFVVFVVLDVFHKYFIFYIPLYFFIRTIVLMWLYLPCFNGAIIFYNIALVELVMFKSKYDSNDSMLAELRKKKKQKAE